MSVIFAYFCIGAIFDYMFKIQHFFMHKYFNNLLSSDKYIKCTMTIVGFYFLFSLLYPLFVIVMIFLKLKEWDDELL